MQSSDRKNRKQGNIGATVTAKHRGVEYDPTKVGLIEGARLIDEKIDRQSRVADEVARVNAIWAA